MSLFVPIALFFIIVSWLIHSSNNGNLRGTFSLILLPTVSSVCLSTFLTHSPNRLYQFCSQPGEQEEDSDGIFRAICYCGIEEFVTPCTDCQFVLWWERWSSDKSMCGLFLKNPWTIFSTHWGKWMVKQPVNVS